MTDGNTAVALFEDPAGGKAIVVRQKIWPKLDKIDAGEPAAALCRQGPALCVSISIEGAGRRASCRRSRRR